MDSNIFKILQSSDKKEEGAWFYFNNIGFKVKSGESEEFIKLRQDKEVKYADQMKRKPNESEEQYQARVIELRGQIMKEAFIEVPMVTDWQLTVKYSDIPEDRRPPLESGQTADSVVKLPCTPDFIKDVFSKKEAENCLGVLLLHCVSNEGYELTEEEFDQLGKHFFTS